MSTLPTPGPREAGTSAWMGQTGAGLPAINRDLSVMTRVGGERGRWPGWEWGAVASGPPPQIEQPQGPRLCSGEAGGSFSKGQTHAGAQATLVPSPRYEMRGEGVWL